MVHAPVWDIEWHAEIGSTMERASELADAGAPPGTVVAAEFQSQGRGTHGRVWLAPPGTCLMFTVLLRPVLSLEALPELPLRIADGIAAYLRERFEVDAVVSPPNDIEIAGRKACGVLCVSRVTGERLDWLLCGVGLNTFMRAEDLPLPTATSLAVEGVTGIPEHGEFIHEVLGSMEWLLRGREPSPPAATQRVPRPCEGEGRCRIH